MSNYKAIYYQKENCQIEIKQDELTGQFYLSVEQIAKLFSKDKSNILKHIKNLLAKGILNKESTMAKFATMPLNGRSYFIDLYALDVVVEVGRNFKTLEGIKLKQYLIENYSQNNELESLKDEEVIIYNNGDISIDVRVSPKEDTVWLTQEAIASLFKTTKSNISMHINNIYEDGEFFLNRTVQDSLTVGNIPRVEKDVVSEKKEGKRTVRRIITYYSLDMVLAVGFRVKSQEAIVFRRWAYSVLKNHLIKGYTIDPNRALVTKDNYLELKNKVLELEVDVYKAKEDIKEIKDEIDPKQIIFEEGTYFDSYKYVVEIIQRAKEMVEVIDPYVDDKALKIIAKSNKNVRRIIYTSSYAKIDETDKELFQKQYGNLNIIIKDNFHDRFLLNEKEVYLIGSSLNYIGNKLFMIIKIEDKEIANLIRHKYPIV